VKTRAEIGTGSGKREQEKKSGPAAWQCDHLDSTSDADDYGSLCLEMDLANLI